MKRPHLTVLQYSMLSHLVTGIGFLLLGLLDFVSGSAIKPRRENPSACRGDESAHPSLSILTYTI